MEKIKQRKILEKIKQRNERKNDTINSYEDSDSYEEEPKTFNSF